MKIYGHTRARGELTVIVTPDGADYPRHQIKVTCEAISLFRRDSAEGLLFGPLEIPLALVPFVFEALSSYGEGGSVRAGPFGLDSVLSVEEEAEPEGDSPNYTEEPTLETLRDRVRVAFLGGSVTADYWDGEWVHPGDPAWDAEQYERAGASPLPRLQEAEQAFWEEQRRWGYLHDTILETILLTLSERQGIPV